MAKSHILRPPPLAALILVATLLSLVAPPCMAKDKTMLFSGESLLSGHLLTNGVYSLNMRADCNLMMYEYNRGIWASDTEGKGQGCRAKLESNGELVVYDKNTTVVWSSGRKGPKGRYVLFIEAHDDPRLAPTRNAVVYGPLLWSTA